MLHSIKKSSFILVTVLVTVLMPAFMVGTSTVKADTMTTCQNFSATHMTVCGKFLDYWNSHGGLAQQGYPISGEIQEKSDTDGKTYTVQYFERARFEAHPENQAPNDVLLGQLGTYVYGLKYGPNKPAQSAPAADCKCNAETDTMPINTDDHKSYVLPKGYWDIMDTSCGGTTDVLEHGCYNIYPRYSDGTLVLPADDSANGHMRAWYVHGGRIEANCTVLTEATNLAKEHPDWHITIQQQLTDK